MDDDGRLTQSCGGHDGDVEEQYLNRERNPASTSTNVPINRLGAVCAVPSDQKCLKVKIDWRRGRSARQTRAAKVETFEVWTTWNLRRQSAWSPAFIKLPSKYSGKELPLVQSGRLSISTRPRRAVQCVRLSPAPSSLPSLLALPASYAPSVSDCNTYLLDGATVILEHSTELHLPFAKIDASIDHRHFLRPRPDPISGFAL
ncbi:hypothetical protein QBC32DRAFT_78102 [Pseudoneurospora amorphoporcata]|uniref:Uncharacterized protein n=1 Tax=Pseudoneurospora amorphoporcata TaxID=241081 RepID=A0AAN6NMR7_9PEZI|nr:hypothetical protein QBC32DRAFT_78102 [Pseudoneurospora amorphoporcata]